MPHKDNLDSVKLEIQIWIKVFADFMEGKIDFLPSEILSQQKSNIGKWLTSNFESFRIIDEIQEFRVKHIKLHKFANEIYNLKKDNQIALAEDFFGDLRINALQLNDLLAAATDKLYLIRKENEQIDLNSSLTAVVWDKSLKLLIETDAEGNVVFVNKNFANVCGIEDIEFIGKPLSHHNSTDMPRIIYEMMVEKAKLKIVRPTIMKFTAKSGQFFWVFANYKVNVNSKNGTIDSYTFNLTGLNKNLLDNCIEPLYNKLKEIEDKESKANCEKYLKVYLKERNRTYDDFILNLVKTGEDTVKTDKEAKGGLFKRFGL